MINLRNHADRAIARQMLAMLAAGIAVAAMVGFGTEFLAAGDALTNSIANAEVAQ